MRLPELPISPLLPQIQQHLAQHNALVIEAPPGAGKSTLVALSLLDAPWCQGKILLLEPRRLAARSVAQRMAELLGEPLGERVGYRIKQDSCIGPNGRIEVITEGILIRQLQQDPLLDGVSLILFDEFHERSLNADLALSLSQEIQSQLRPDLRLVPMSATLDGERLSQFLDCQRLQSKGRCFPVAIDYRPAPDPHWLSHLCRQLHQALWQESTEILVFLPGSGEIRRVIATLEAELPDNVQLLPLYGDLDWQQQRQVLQPKPGVRRVILATAIAETSLTLDGIELVIDSGWQRKPGFDPNSGITRLLTRRLSQASANQRAGRAGRTGPGRCWRLWSATERLDEFNAPEILQADLSPLALELASWGSSQLQWLDAPPPGALAQAYQLLEQLGAVDDQQRLTALGRELNRLPLEPRLAKLFWDAEQRGQASLGAYLAAYLSANERAQNPGCDLAQRVTDALHSSRHSLWLQQALSLLKQRNQPRTTPDWEQTGLLLAAAYPDRIACRRPGTGNRYLLSNGSGAAFGQYEALANAEWLVIAELSGRDREARIFAAAELDITQLPAWQQSPWQSQLSWNHAEQRLEAQELRKLGALVLAQRPLSQTPADWHDWLLALLRRDGLKLLPWTDRALHLRHRQERARQRQPDAWPASDEQGLLAELELWLQPYLPTELQRQPFQQLDLYPLLWYRLDSAQQRELDARFPDAFTSPAGGRHRIDYSGQTPRIALKLQEVLGLAVHPKIGDQPLVFELLSPGNRPIQITADLPGFWQGAYQAVRKDMHSQYPRHYWPEDPLQATPSLKTSKKALARGDS